MEEDLLSVTNAFSTALHMSVGAFSDAVAAEELPYDTAMAALEKVRTPYTELVCRGLSARWSLDALAA